MLLYVGLPTGGCLAAAAIASEGQTLLHHGWHIACQMPGLLSLLMASSVLVNLSTCFSIRLTSSLTFKTIGCLKNAAVIVVGVLCGDVVRPTSVLSDI